jgi:hypothetical protein
MTGCAGGPGNTMADHRSVNVEVLKEILTILSSINKRVAELLVNQEALRTLLEARGVLQAGEVDRQSADLRARWEAGRAREEEPSKDAELERLLRLIKDFEGTEH